jgi:hypothetical protein
MKENLLKTRESIYFVTTRHILADRERIPLFPGSNSLSICLNPPLLNIIVPATAGGLKTHLSWGRVLTRIRIFKSLTVACERNQDKGEAKLIGGTVSKALSIITPDIQSRTSLPLTQKPHSGYHRAVSESAPDTETKTCWFLWQ